MRKIIDIHNGLVDIDKIESISPIDAETGKRFFIYSDSGKTYEAVYDTRERTHQTRELIIKMWTA
jgi:spore germination protein YaaH